MYFPRIPGVLNARGGLDGSWGRMLFYSLSLSGCCDAVVIPCCASAIDQCWCSQEHLCTGNMSKHSTHYECFFLKCSFSCPLARNDVFYYSPLTTEKCRSGLKCVIFCSATDGFQFWKHKTGNGRFFINWISFHSNRELTFEYIFFLSSVFIHFHSGAQTGPPPCLFLISVSFSFSASHFTLTSPIPLHHSVPVALFRFFHLCVYSDS